MGSLSKVWVAPPSAARYEVNHRATRYVGWLFHPETDQVYILLLTGSTGNAGQWIRLGETDAIAWDYLDEKMPAIGNNGGDKEGWVKLFAEMGIEVFGVNGDIRLPIKVSGYIVIREGRTLRVEYDTTSWEFAPLNRTNEIDDQVVLFERAGEPHGRDYDADVVDAARKTTERWEPIDVEWVKNPDVVVIGEATPEVR